MIGQPTISIIIPALNEEKYLGKLLTSIQSQSLQPSEVIVVDAQSSDQTVTIAKKFHTVKILSTKPNIAHQRNFGAQAAKGDVLLFLDADTTIHPHFIEHCIHTMMKRKLDIACPWYWPKNSTLLIQAMYGFLNALFFCFQWLQPSGAGSCILIKRAVYQQFGGFNETMKFDDIELIRRIGNRTRFANMLVPVYVSDRRFRKEGVLPTMLTYTILSILFFFHQFKLANRVPYLFAHYHHKKTKNS